VFVQYAMETFIIFSWNYFIKPKFMLLMFFCVTIANKRKEKGKNRAHERAVIELSTKKSFSWFCLRNYFHEKIHDIGRHKNSEILYYILYYLVIIIS
jgi:hypothetical protein